jgi:hypothetical protein
MQKKYLLFYFLLIAIGSQAQQKLGTTPHALPNNLNSINSSRANTTLYMDYSFLNHDNNSVGWPINSYYANDSLVSYVGVAYDNITGYYDYADYQNTVVSSSALGFANNFPADAAMRIDSVLSFIAHENNSGIADTIIMELHNLDVANNITNVVLWSDTLITSVGLSPSNNITDGFSSYLFLNFNVGYTTAAGEKPAFVLRYLNHNKLDSMAIAAGFVNFSAFSPGAIQSNYKNSFIKISPFTPANSVVKNSSLSNFYIDGSYFAGQNWIIIPSVEVFNTTLGLQSAKGNLKLNSLYPNPANNLLKVSFESLQENQYTIEIIDVNGRLVFNTVAKAMVGNNNISLPIDKLMDGLYAINISQGNQQYSQRFIVKK